MMYGPTTGDKVRLADTNLVIEVEKDYTTYGDECKFGAEKPSGTDGPVGEDYQRGRRPGSGDHQCPGVGLYRNL